MHSSIQVIVHRGSRQIGGSCVEIATATTRVLIDAGAPLDDSVPCDLPPIAGVTLSGTPPDAVLLSHAHGDHSALLCQIPQEVPVYLTKGTSKMLLAGEIFCGQTPLPRERQRTMEIGVAVIIGDLTITALAVDHSVFGAVAFLIEAAGKRVLYSGDLRLHGRKPGMAKSLIQAVGVAPLDLLLMEGTHLSRDLDAIAVTEWDLEKLICKEIAAAPSLALAFFSPQHLDRLVAFHKAARAAGRTFVVDLYGAFVMHLLHSEVAIPDPAKDQNLRVYFPQRRASIPSFEKRLVKKTITLDLILTAPASYVMLCRPSMLFRDLKRRVPNGTLGIYSMWQGYLKRDDWQQTLGILTAVGGRFAECHTSGHASVPDLLSLIHDLKPSRIIPIHTERPELLKELVSNVEVTQDGLPIEL